MAKTTAMLVLKSVLLPVAIALIGSLSDFWVRALGWFAVGALFAAIPPRITNWRAATIGVIACAAATAVIVLGMR